MNARIALVLAFALAAVAPRTPRAAALAPVANDTETIVHVLNRIGYGPRPGDVEQVRRLGLDKYIDQQLYPGRIDDPEMDARLAHLVTVNMSSREISERYEQPQIEARQQRKLDAAQTPPGQTPSAPRRPQDQRRQQALDPDMRQPQDPDMRQPKAGAVTPRQMAAGNGAGQGAQSVLLELQEQKLVRAIYSERQLQEVLTDFWFNHFNVDARKGRDRFLLTEYEREAIRPHVLGKFRDLLGATAKSPAMLFYLDNAQSVDPEAANRAQQRPFRAAVGRGRFGMPAPMPPPPQAQQVKKRGLNENYGRELMELHTLGVDGGYTQKDVTEVARAFTGWSIDNPRQGGGFVFNARMHDEREKVVLGHRIRVGGIRDGEAVLDILAAEPATARFISTKLARRFVSDAPPDSIVDRLATRFTDTKGDLREVMRTLLASPEFLAPAARHAKVKTPLEFIVSSVRATGADVTNARMLVNGVQQLGMPLYQCQPPTGYKDTAEVWTNTGALVGRMNFATNLATNRQFGMAGRLQTPGTRDQMIETILGPSVADSTRAVIAKASTPAQMLALTLGSPEFQRR